MSTSTEQRSSGQIYPEKDAPIQHPISNLAKSRWSTRAFDEQRMVEPEKILCLLEAARWAPSCYNEQPWHYLVFDGADREALDKARACLNEFNAWARKAPVLMLSVARERFTGNRMPNRHAQHDLGLASGSLILEAVNQGLALHQMAGFDCERARKEFAIPEGFTPVAMIAIGYPYSGDVNHLPAQLREMELQPRQRKPIREIAFSGSWSVPFIRL